MALIRCPECGREISNKAATCIGCGYILRDHRDMPQESDEIEVWLTNKTGFPWRVLARDGVLVLAMTENVIECRAYNDSDMQVSWETCTLRKYLNNEFYNSLPWAIKERIVEMENEIEPLEIATKYDKGVGNPTIDKVFLLSKNEVGIYYQKNQEVTDPPKDDCIDEDDTTTPYYNEEDYGHGGPLQDWLNDSDQYIDENEWSSRKNAVLIKQQEWQEERNEQLLAEAEQEESARIAKFKNTRSGWWLSSTTTWLRSAIGDQADSIWWHGYICTYPVYEVLGIRPVMCLNVQAKHTSGALPLIEDIGKPRGCRQVPITLPNLLDWDSAPVAEADILPAAREIDLTAYDEDIPF